jgi:hypothetical protein
MRACFLGQNVCALGFGVAVMQTPALMELGAAPDPVSGAAPEPDPHASELPNRMFAALAKFPADMVLL